MATLAREPMQDLLWGVSGSAVGVTLGLFGGGGSILAMPMMMCFVGGPSAHVAIGASAFAVAAAAGSNLCDASHLMRYKRS
ncbi:hypothetical protein [Methylopila turkensis]|uniref:Uncharacterized protein n=1 Tax=Methylopila turkensis TaxID=1437816 RepID=A0A9W6JPC4_9HYPH|nr:hypothetical protein [Methylopila turkensis]GLK79148.1 hypothetical protein GCM10008174_08890 [Methylopila turkensis]